MLLQVTDLTIRPSEEVDLRNINFSVDQGECVVIRSPILLLGTRLLQALLGLEDALSGQVWFDQHDMVADLPLGRRLKLRRHIGYVHRVGGLVSLLNVRENIILPLSYHENVARTRIKTLTQEVSEALEIEHLLDREVDELNMVQTRLVNLARALICRPRLLLVDAILEGMNKQQLQRMTAAISRYRQDSGFAVVMTARSHALPWANRVYELRHGTLHEVTD